MRQVTHDGRGSLQIRFAFDRTLVDLVKGLPERRWNPAGKYWSVPEDGVVALVDLLHPRGFDFDEQTRRLYDACGGTRDLAPPRPAAGGPGERSGSPQLDLFGGDSRDQGTRLAAGPDEAGDYSVSRLNEQVRALLDQAFPAPVWLIGEISGFDKNAGRRIVSFKLAERSEDGRTLSEINAVLFDDVRSAIEDKLARAGDPFRLQDEVTVRLRVRVDLYVPWGMYRAVVEDLDIRYTLGEAARRREEIVRRLTEQGLVGLNTALEFPALPLRVGLVTSLGSDACNDVLRTLQESGFAFRVTVHGARVQGPQTEASVLNALDRLRSRADRFDVVLICRGGGSRIDLAWFDSEALGRAVARFPLPVVVGIGHEQDQSVLDSVGRSCKTPTAAAMLLVEAVRAALDRVEQIGMGVLERAGRRLRDEAATVVERGRRLVRAARSLVTLHATALAGRQHRAVLGTRALLKDARTRLEQLATAGPRSALQSIAEQRGRLDRGARQLMQAARREIEAGRRQVDQLGARGAPLARRRLELERERTAARSRRLELAHPARVLRRGYAILRREDGRVVTDPDLAPAGTRVAAELRSGGLALRSEGAARGPDDAADR